MFILRELRREQGKTQKDLAEYMGLTQATISDWEVSKVEPSIEWLIKLADFFNVSIDFLVGRESDFISSGKSDTRLSDSERRLIKAFIQLDEDTQEKLIEDAEFYVQLAQSKSGAKRKA